MLWMSDRAAIISVSILMDFEDFCNCSRLTPFHHDQYHPVFLRNGDTYVAPARAARSAWFALKIRVTFVLMPSLAKY